METLFIAIFSLVGLETSIAEACIVVSGRSFRCHRPLRMIDQTQFCAICDDTGWVCEDHPGRPWTAEHACGCGGAGAPLLRLQLQRRSGHRPFKWDYQPCIT